MRVWPAVIQYDFWELILILQQRVYSRSSGFVFLTFFSLSRLIFHVLSCLAHEIYYVQIKLQSNLSQKLNTGRLTLRTRIRIDHRECSDFVFIVAGPQIILRVFSRSSIEYNNVVYVVSTYRWLIGEHVYSLNARQHDVSYRCDWTKSQVERCNKKWMNKNRIFHTTLVIERNGLVSFKQCCTSNSRNNNIIIIRSMSDE